MTDPVTPPVSTEAPLSTTQPTDTRKLSVDIAPGVSIELDIDTAKKVIAARDAKSKGFKELETKVKDMEGQVAKERERAEIMEKLKTGAFEEAEVLASKRANDRLAKWQTRIVDKEVQALLLGNPEFIGGEATQDASKLLKADNKLAIDDDGNITANGKPILEIVNEFVSKRDMYRKAKIGVGTGATQTNKLQPPKKALSGDQAMSIGLQKFLKK